jgi:hypothetical protein
MRHTPRYLLTDRDEIRRSIEDVVVRTAVVVAVLERGIGNLSQKSLPG